MPLSWPYGVTRPVVGQMFHVKHWLWRCSCSGRRVCCPAGRAARSARGRRPARSPSAPRASLGASSRSPARPRHRPRAPQPGPPVTPAPSTPAAPGVLACGPATAHGHRGQALRSLWRPPHRWHLVCWPALAPQPPTGTATVPATVCKKSAAPAGLRTCVELRRCRNSLSGGRPSPGAWRRRAR